MELPFCQTRFFPFKDGAPSIHSLRANPSKSGVLVTTDRTVHVLRYDNQSNAFRLDEIAFLDEPVDHIDVIASGAIECPGRERIVVAYAEVSDDDDDDHTVESTTGESNDKLFLSVIDPRNKVAIAKSVTKDSSTQAKPKSKPKGKTSSQNHSAVGAPPSEQLQSSSTIRFELVAAPTMITSIRAKSLASSSGTVSSEFNGVILFRMESMVAIGFVDDALASEKSAQCVRLSNEQFAAFFPEFAQFNHPVLTVDVHIDHAEERGWIAFGCADGVVRVFAGSRLNSILSGPYEIRDLRMDGPVLAVSLFMTKREGRIVCSLLAGCAIGHAIVYEDLFGQPRGDPIRNEKLVGSDQYDSIFSVLAADIDLDGESELLIGTDDQALIAYKQNQSPQPATAPTDAPSSEKAMGNEAPSLTTTAASRWCQLSPDRWQMRAFGGIYSLAWLDLNRDGVRELVLASSTGVYIYEADAKVVLRRLEAMLEAASPGTARP